MMGGRGRARARASRGESIDSRKDSEGMFRRKGKEG